MNLHQSPLHDGVRDTSRSHVVDVSDLDARMRLFDTLSSVQKNALLAAVLQNDVRGLTTENRDPEIVAAIEQLEDHFERAGTSNAPSAQSKFEHALAAFESRAGRCGTLTARMLERNSALSDAGFCPLIHYAFDTWLLDSAQPCHVRHVAELSVTYLYRLVPILHPYEPRLGDNLIGSGAYCDVYFDPLGDGVTKVPKNLAARAFANAEEALVLELVRPFIASARFPRLISYNPSSGNLCRSFVRGKSGHTLLQSDFFTETPRAIDDLRRFYEEIGEFSAVTGWYMDLHPSNIVWQSHESRWYLVDAGPIPNIARCYYPERDFDRYFTRVWCERLERMRSHPIRSVFLGGLAPPLQ